MIDDLAFLEVIQQSPADDGPRLIYADFLEDQGDPIHCSRAELIRIQCLIARGNLDSEQLRTILVREQTLLTNFWRLWIRPICQALSEPVPMGPTPIKQPKIFRGQPTSFEEIARREKYFLKKVMEQGPWTHVIEQFWGNGRDIPYLHSAQFRRGFVSHVTIAAKSYRTAQHIIRLFEKTPLEGLAIVGCTPSQIVDICRDVDLSRLRTLELIFVDPSVIQLTALHGSLQNLERLIIRNPHGTDDICRSLISPSNLTRLKHLTLRACQVSRDGIEELIQQPFARDLKTLGFPDCDGLNEQSLMTICEAGTWPNLEELDVSGARLSFTMREILGSRFANRLRTDNIENHWPELYQFD